MRHLGDQPFLEEFKPLLERGLKTATTRSDKWGEPGDRFTAFGLEFELTRVELRKLRDVATESYRAEGFDDPYEFVDIWKRLHPAAGWDPELPRWFHEFKPLFTPARPHLGIREVFVWVKRQPDYRHSFVSASEFFFGKRLKPSQDIPTASRLSHRLSVARRQIERHERGTFWRRKVGKGNAAVYEYEFRRGAGGRSA